MVMSRVRLESPGANEELKNQESHQCTTEAPVFKLYR